jgi:transposase
MGNMISSQPDCQVISMGIDVHDETYAVSLFCNGAEIHSQSCSAEYSQIRRIVRRYSKFRIVAAYEAGAFGYGLYDRLMADGIHTIVTPPSKIPTARGDRVKTDRIDARKLAQLLSSGLLRAVTVPSKQVREDREILRTRDQLVEHRRRCMVQLKSKLRMHGLPVPRARLGVVSRARLETLPMEASLRSAFSMLLRTYDFYTAELQQARRLLLELVEQPSYKSTVELLRTIPGVGLLTALGWVLEVPPVRHFVSSQKLASWLGLTPSEHTSSGNIRRGRITGCGNTKMRWMLIEAAWTAVRKDPALQQFYERVRRRRGGKRAIVGVARKLSARIRAMLQTQRPYVLATVR